MFVQGPFRGFRVFRPRHPLARLLAGVVGVVALLLLVAIGSFLVVALAVGGALFVLFNALRAPSRARTAGSPGASPAAPPGVIEGEFTVVPVHAGDRRGAR